MPLSSRNRSACDRCHSQKLKCPKQTGSAICARCLKAGAKCVYSPPGTRLVAIDGQTMPMDAALSDAVMRDDTMRSAFGADERSDWTVWPSDFDFTSFLPASSTNVVPSNQCNIQDEGPVHAGTISEKPAAEESSEARSACTKELTSLLLESDETFARLSMDSGLHTSKSGASDSFLDALSAKVATRHVLESFFVLAQRLIEIYPAAITISLKPSLKPSSACDIPDCTHMIDLALGLKEVEDGVLQQGTFSGPDIALANLLVACHARQLDILDRVFLIVASCTRATLASRREPDFDVSEMRVGSFVPQRTAAVLMQIALLKHLVAGLTDRLVSFGKAVLTWSEGSTNTVLENSILKLQHESMTKRQASKVKQVRLIEDFLLKFDFNKD